MGSSELSHFINVTVTFDLIILVNYTLCEILSCKKNATNVFGDFTVTFDHQNLDSSSLCPGGSLRNSLKVCQGMTYFIHQIEIEGQVDEKPENIKATMKYNFIWALDILFF